VARFSCWRGHLGASQSYGCGCSGHDGEVHEVSQGHRHGAKDAIYLGALMGKFYALLRMRPLSIYCAEGFLVISRGKVDYDKSGWRDD
jgi:hypothetical protein